MNPKTFSRAAALALAAALLAGAAAAQTARGGSDPAVAGEILLKLQTTGTLPGLLAKYPLTLVSTLGARPIYRVKVVGSTPVDGLITQLLLEPGVQLAETHPLNQSPEARKNLVWAIGTEVEYHAQWAPAAVHLPQAQARSSGAGVRVAVLDTGVDRSHPALAGRLLPGRDFVDGDNDPSEGGGPADPAYGHGTHVAGLVALAAPGAQILPLRVLAPSGAGNLWTIAEAMLYAVDPDGNPATDDGAHVINLSLGSLSRTALFDTLQQLSACNPPARGPAFELSDPGYDGDKARCRNRRGAVVVAAAGNDGSRSAKQYPAAESAYGLVSVAASDETKQIASFSNAGGWITGAAPGDKITSTMAGGGYATWSGTSMAAPLVSGMVALLRALDAQISAKDLAVRAGRTTTALCGGAKLGQFDALGLLDGVAPPDTTCP